MTITHRYASTLQAGYALALDEIIRLACPHLHTVTDEVGGPEPWEKREVVRRIDCGEEVHPIHEVNPVAEIGI